MRKKSTKEMRTRTRWLDLTVGTLMRFVFEDGMVASRGDGRGSGEAKVRVFVDWQYETRRMSEKVAVAIPFLLRCCR
jgi:hypothetical protein